MLKELTGRFASTPTEMPRGSCPVRAAQPLGILIFRLLEPEGTEGVEARGFLDGELPPGEAYPIHMCYRPLHVASERVKQ